MVNKTKDLKNLTREELLNLIEKKATQVEASITRNQEGVAILSKSDDYTPCV